MSTLPSDLAFLVSILIGMLSNYLRSDNLPRWANGFIAIIAIVLIGVLIGWLTTGYTLDIKQDILLTINIIVSLFTGIKELADLLAYLQNANSPLVPETVEPITRRKTL